MRLLSLLALAVVCQMSTAFAQERREFGAKAGPNFSTVDFDPDEGNDYDRRVSIGGGGFAVLPLSRLVAVQIEALFNPKGAKLYDPELNFTGSVLLHYFETPVLLRVNGPRRGAGMFHVFGGPYSGIRMRATREISIVANSVTSGERTDMGDEIRRFEFGLVAGAGFDIGRRLVIDGRYTHALTNLNTCEGAVPLCTPGDGLRVRNRTVMFMFGARF